jgi:predicted ATP-grasp superfamily ATP-dependent carboligase
MRIFIHEYVSGGGLAGQALPNRMAHEGLLMLRAILQDFRASGRHEIRSTLDARLRHLVPTNFPMTLIDGHRYEETFALSLDWAEAVLLIAPETDGILERLSSEVEHAGKRLLGSRSEAVAAAGDKATTDRRFRRHGLPTPRTRLVHLDADSVRHITSFACPAVVKPVDGAGCEGTSVVRHPAQIPAALRRLHRATRRQTFLVQEYVAGTAASLSCLSDGARVLPLTLNTQYIRNGRGLSYRGGTVHIDHPSRSLAFEMMADLPRVFPGLKGYFGVDLVLTPSGPVLIEINPRLTTAYVGLRRAFSANLADVIVQSALGRLPRLPRPQGPVRFSVGRARRRGRERG